MTWTKLSMTALCLLAAPRVALGGDCLFIPDAVDAQGLVDGESMDVLIFDGALKRLQSAQDKKKVPEGCEVAEGKGLFVTPGFIAAHTHLGLVEVGIEDLTVDAYPEDYAGSHPSFDVFDGYNPRSTLIPIARSKGVTHAIVAPEYGRFGGSGSAVRLSGRLQSDVLVEPGIAAYASLDTQEGSRAEAIGDLRGMLQEASIYRLMKPDWVQGASRPFSYPVRELEALFPVVDGLIPLVVAADRASDIEALHRMRMEFSGLRLVFLGAAEALEVKELLMAFGYPIIVDPRRFAPGDFDTLYGRPDSLGELSGVEVIIAGEETHRVGILRELASIAMMGGMSWEGAIRAITSTPAQVFGLEGLGALEEGARANLVVWDGNPLELGSRVIKVYIDGESVSLKNRQDALFERYRTLPGTPAAPLPLPEGLFSE